MTSGASQSRAGSTVSGTDEAYVEGYGYGHNTAFPQRSGRTCARSRRRSTTSSAMPWGGGTGDMTQRDRLRVVAVLNAIGWAYSHKSHGLACYTRAACGEDAQREHNMGEAAD